MGLKEDGEAIYRALGVAPVIVATGALTARGGSKLRPEVMAAMNAAASVMVDMNELNRKAGEVLARHTGAEAGFVCSGSAGGLVLQAAAVIAGADRGRMARLPDTTGMKNEIIIHRCQRFPYDQAYRTAGARLVEFGDGWRAHPWQLEAAFTERTAAVAYLFSPYLTRNAVPLEQVVEIAHARDVPVLVNAASLLPPRANLKRFIAAGADMVVYSGGKGVRGPQGTGILVGRADLIEAAAGNASPQQFLGRGLKVAKEEIVGLVEALELFVAEDEAAQMRRYREMGEQAVQALGDMEGLRITVEQDGHDFLVPSTVLRFGPGWRGRPPASIHRSMRAGEPSICLNDLLDPSVLTIDPLNLDDDELAIVIRRLGEELRRAG